MAEAIRRRREEEATEVVGQLAALLPDAVATLGSGLGSEKDHDRLRASQLIVELLLKVRQRVEVDADLAELRDELRRAGSGGRG